MILIVCLLVIGSFIIIEKNKVVAEPITHFEVTSLLDSTGSSLSVTVGDGRPAGFYKIYATNTDHHLYEYNYSGGIWIKTDMGDIGGASESSIVIGDGRYDGIIRVYVGSPDGNIYEFTYSSGNWIKTIVGSGTGAMSDIAMGEGWNDCFPQIYGVNLDLHVYQFNYSGGWNKLDMGTGGKLGITIGDARNDGFNRVYAVDNSETYEYNWSGGWSSSLISSSGGNKISIAQGRNDGINRLYYGGDQKSWELTYNSGIWDLETVVNRSGMTSSTNAMVVRSCRDDGLNRVYWGDDGHLSSGHFVEVTYNISSNSWDCDEGSGGFVYLDSETSNHTYGLGIGNGRNDGVTRIYRASSGGYLCEWTFNGSSLDVSINANPSVIESGNTITISVLVTDGLNPVEGATVTLTSNNGGSFNPTDGTTNMTGHFTSVFTAPSVTIQTICRITAQVSKTGYSDKSGYADITVNPLDLPSLYITMETFQESMESGQSFNFTCHITDGLNPVEGVAVSLTSDNGSSVDPESGTTDYNGDFIFIFNTPEITDYTLCKITLEVTKSGYNDNLEIFSVIVYPDANVNVIDALSDVPIVDRGSAIAFYVVLKNNEDYPVYDLQVYVNISDPYGEIVYRDILLEDIDLIPYQEYTSQYILSWYIPEDAVTGKYRVTIELWDELLLTQYDIKVDITCFDVVLSHMILDVPYYNQYPSLWCSPTCLAMVLHYYENKHIHAWDMAAKWKLKNGDGSGDYFAWLDPLSNENQLLDIYELTKYGPTLGVAVGDFQTYKDSLNLGYPIHLVGYGHTVVVIGYSQELNEDYLYINDPSGYLVRDKMGFNQDFYRSKIPWSTFKVFFPGNDPFDTGKFIVIIEGNRVGSPMHSISEFGDFTIGDKYDLYRELGLRWNDTVNNKIGYFGQNQEERYISSTSFMVNNNRYQYTLVQINLQINDIHGNVIFDSRTVNPIKLDPYKHKYLELINLLELTKTEKKSDDRRIINMTQWNEGWYRIYFGLWKYNTSYIESEKYDFIGELNSIWFYLGDEKEPEPPFTEIRIKCPVNLTITNSKGERIGIVNGQYINEIPNAVALSSDDPEIYLVPSNDTYTIEVNGYDNGNYDLEFILPYEDLTRTFSFLNTTLLESTKDTYTLTPFGVSISTLTNDIDKNCGLNISESKGNLTKYFEIKNIIMEKGKTYNFEVLYWDTISDESNKSVCLSIDEDNDGILDYDIYLHNGITGTEINELIELQKAEDSEDISDSEDGLNWTLYIGIILIVIGLIITALFIQRKRSKNPPDKEEKIDDKENNEDS